MRGIIPAQILSHLAEDLRKAGDRRPLYSHFDLIAGTSTGALIAAAASIPVEGTAFTAEDSNEDVFTVTEERKFLRTRRVRRFRGTIIPSTAPATFTSFYISNGPSIFPQKSVAAILGPIFTDKYSGSGYSRFLQKLYGEKLMGDLMVPTALLSYSTDSGTIFPITSWNTPDFKIWEGARASSAAPLYFPTFIREYNGRKLHLIDGGVAANNPSLIAYSLARKLYPEAGEFRILSLSTGTPVYRTEGESTPGGITGWGGQISRIFQNAALQVADETLPAIPGVKYTRIWAQVLDRRIRLDETGKESMEILLRAAEKMYEEKHQELDEWTGMLSKAPTPDAVRLRVPGALPQP